MNIGGRQDCFRARYGHHAEGYSGARSLFGDLIHHAETVPRGVPPRRGRGRPQTSPHFFRSRKTSGSARPRCTTGSRKPTSKTVTGQERPRKNPRTVYSLRWRLTARRSPRSSVCRGCVERRNSSAPVSGANSLLGAVALPLAGVIPPPVLRRGLLRRLRETEPGRPIPRADAWRRDSTGGRGLGR